MKRTRTLGAILLGFLDAPNYKTARALNISEAALSRMLNGLTVPRRSTVEKLAAYLTTEISVPISAELLMQSLTAANVVASTEGGS